MSDIVEPIILSPTTNALNPEPIELDNIKPLKPIPTKSESPSKSFSILENKDKIKKFLNKQLPFIFKHGPGTVKTAPYLVAFPAMAKTKNQNYISTQKYSILTFIPYNLFFQFRRFYNFYFLIGALSIFAGFSSLSYTSQVLPLVVVLGFSAAKEAIEDYNRYRADTTANNTPVVLIADGVKKTVPAMALKPGDIVYVSKGSKFFVDVILLSSSYDDGTAFIDTAELDGETNLKRKSTASETIGHTTDDKIKSVAGNIECEHPNENLLSFEGRIKFNQSETAAPLSLLNLVPRGSVLRNTDFVYGLVIYVGKFTKIMKNLKPAKLKSSSLEAKLNNLVLYAFVYNAILLFTSVILENVGYTSIRSGENVITDEIGKMWYIGFQSTNGSYHTWASTVSFFTLYTYVIPISLFVTIELCRLGQATYMVWDPKMMYRREEADMSIKHIPMRVNNSNLNEDLGAIDYIFSDKTGTLTQNVMKMSMMWVEGYSMDEMKEPGIVLRHIKDNALPVAVREQMNLFMTALSVCHGVIPAYDEVRKELMYESQSPDETALLVAARQNKYSLIKRTKQDMVVAIDGVDTQFSILGVVEFNSTRKRMSVVVKMKEQGKSVIRVFCKGADNIMMARLDKSPSGNDAQVLQKADASLIEFSNIGLRTLVIGSRVLSEAEFDKFKKQWDAAELSLDGNRDELLDAASDLIESNMCLLGCTAIEDKLQDKVPETIENLLLSGIKMWLLTGDKQETAINIGLSSRLINRQMRVVILAGKGVEECENEMDTLIQEQDTAPEIFALVVDGSVLSNVFAGAQKSKDKFLMIGKRCKTVICSRVTPLQKSLVVRLVRKSLKTSITLAIGDGANDVSMIQEAHIGVGIMGKEGTQAVRAADYAFGEFRFLQRLLNVHGRFSYRRMTNLILFSFYKNLTFITIQWYFGFVNFWSGQIVYEELFFTVFNVIFTSIPPLMYALYEKDLPEVLLEKYPQFYREIKNGLYWNFNIIARWFSLSIIHSLLIFGVVYFLNFEGTVDILGRSTGYWVQTYLLSSPLLLVVLLKHATITHFWFWLPIVGLVISFLFNIILMFFLILLDSFFYSDYATGVIAHVLPAYYILGILFPAICILPDIFIEYVHGQLYPSDTTLALEYTALNFLKI